MIKIDDFAIRKTSFKLGDQVTSKKTGLPSYGYIVGILTGPVYIKMSHCQIMIPNYTDMEDIETKGMSSVDMIVTRLGYPESIMYELWSKLYPKWPLNPVVYVKFDQPQRNVSFEEYSKSFKGSRDIGKETLKELYSINIPKIDLVSYPVEDLEMLNE